MEARVALEPWRAGDEWLLPGMVDQPPGGSSSGSSSDDDDSDGGSTGSRGITPQVAARGASGTGGSANAAMHSPAADIHAHDPSWLLQMGPGGSRPRPAMEQLYSQPASTSFSRQDAPGVHQVRLLPTTSLRSSPFGPFGSSSLQHRDSLTATQPHPLSLIVQHHHHFPQSPTRQPHPSLTDAPPGQAAPRQQPLIDLRLQPSDPPDLGSSGSGPDGLVPSPSGEGGGGSEDPGGTSTDWQYLAGDPFARTHATSSSSSSASSSRDTTPTPRQPGGPYPVPSAARGNPLWLPEQYGGGGAAGSDVRYEPPGLRLGQGLGRGVSGDAGGVPSELRDRRGVMLDLPAGGINIESLAVGPGSPVSSDSFGSLGSRRRRSTGRSSWSGEEDEGGAGRRLAAGVLGAEAGRPPPLLWPMGHGGEQEPTSGYAAAAGTQLGGSPTAAGGWRVNPVALHHHHHHQQQQQQEIPGLVGGTGPGWRPSRNDGLGESMADLSWDHHYGSLSTSFGLGTTGSTSMMTDSRFSPRSSQAGSTSMGRPTSGAGSARIGSGRMGGAGMGGGGAGSSILSGTTRCFTSLDSPPPGPFERRRVVLTSAQRRPQQQASEAGTPGGGVRQYSEGLAGMLTNAQIQDWMSQHASRLLLPRHMHEIADIVFRPPSAAPEKKPLKTQPGNTTASMLPPPVVLGGRYAPPAVSRVAGDAAFMASLLAGLPGVDPGNSRLQAVITALQGKDLAVLDEDAEGAGGGGQQRLTLTLQRLPSKPARPGSARILQC